MRGEARMKATPILLLLSVAAFAGCTEEKNTVVPAIENIQADLITPGVWIVNGSPDHILVWAHNQMSKKVTINWRIAFTDGAPIPVEWNLTSAKPSATLEPNKTKTPVGGGRFSYPDWAWTMLQIKLPADTPAGEHNLTLDTGESRHNFKIKILANRTRVSQPGDTVNLMYEGKFNDNQQTFDDGSFSTKLGSGQTVPGFDNGLMGLALKEKTTLIIPPPMGYGYDNTDPGYTKFNGRTLRFDVEILKFV